MKLWTPLVVAGLALAFLCNAQTDSIITFSDLKFHTPVEKKAYTNFVQQHTDTLEAFFAVDDLLGAEDLVFLNKKFEDIWNELKAEKVESKKGNAQIKLVYSTVKNNYLKTYAQGEFLSSTLLNGRFNEISASVLLALIFDKLHISYELLDSYDNFSFIVNPGANEQKLEIGAPILLHVEITPEAKKEYVDYMRKCGAATELEMRTYSYSELYDKKAQEQKSITLRELLGLFYYFQSNKELEQGDVNGSLELAQKAFYLYQTPYIQRHFRNCLATMMLHFTVHKASDIDYAIQLNRVGYFDMDATNNLFRGLIADQLAFDDKASLCDSIYERFTSKVQGQELLDELAYSYNLMRLNQKSPNFTDIVRLDKAICIKPNIKEVNDYLEGIMGMNLYKITSSKSRLDSVTSLSSQLKSKKALETLRSLRLTFLLDLAVELYKNKNTKEGEKYLLEFEANCPTPIENERLKTEVEQAYRALAISAYWGVKQDFAANQMMIQRGLKMVPESEMIKSGAYEKNNIKYENTNPIVKSSQKLVDKTPKTGRSIRVISKDKKEKVYSF